MPLSNYHAIEKDLSNIKADALVRLVCVSYRSGKITENLWLEQVFQDHCVFNKKNDIKGFSCKGGNYFFQCLEGVKKNLLTLMAKIFADKRHKSVKVILSESITRCGFKDWNTRCLNLDNLNPDNVSFVDGFIASELQQYLPFKPTHWPVWYIEYFVETMQKFNRDEALYQPTQKRAHNAYSRNRRAKSESIATVSSASSIMATIAVTMSRQPLLVIDVLVVMIIVLMIMLV